MVTGSVGGKLVFATFDSTDIHARSLWAVDPQLPDHAPVARPFTVRSVTEQGVQFLGVESTDPDSDPLSYSWSFGDGATSSQRDPLHVYPDDGTYTATLTVTDSDGLQNSTSIAVVVNRSSSQKQGTWPA
jgi:PKD repeat protein